MNFWNNPQYSSIKVMLLIVVIAVAGYFAITSVHKNALENTGRVIPIELAAPNNGPLQTPFPELCADGQAHIHVISQNNIGGTYIMSSGLPISWEACNLGNPNTSIFVKLITDGSYTYANLNSSQTWVLGTYPIATGTITIPATSLPNQGGFYKVQIHSYIYSLTDNSDSYFLLYADNSYTQAHGTKTFSCPSNNQGYTLTQYFRIPNTVHSVTVEAIGGGGGGGAAVDSNGYGGGGGGAGESLIPTPVIQVIPSGLLSVVAGCGGNGGDYLSNNHTWGENGTASILGGIGLVSNTSTITAYQGLGGQAGQHSGWGLGGYGGYTIDPNNSTSGGNGQGGGNTGQGGVGGINSANNTGWGGHGGSTSGNHNGAGGYSGKVTITW